MRRRKSAHTVILTEYIAWQLVIKMNKQKRIEILCATMHQTDFSKYNEMNINNCDVIYANQADAFAFDEMKMPENIVKMITTATTGVGKNRNIALSLASGEILLFADDDLQYEPDVAETVNNAFQKYPKAEMMIFGIKYAKDGKVFKQRMPKTGRLSFFKALRYGTCAIAIRYSAVLKHNLHFTELFGGGCLYSYGEDTDFVVQCFKKRLKIYSYSAIIATTNKDTSTCFTGYGKKFFFDKGALARHSLGIMTFPYMIRMARKELESELCFTEKLKYLWKGYQCFPELITYDKWTTKQNEKDNYR